MTRHHLLRAPAVTAALVAALGACQLLKHRVSSAAVVDPDAAVFNANVLYSTNPPSSQAEKEKQWFWESHLPQESIARNEKLARVQIAIAVVLTAALVLLDANDDETTREGALGVLSGLALGTVLYAR